MRPHPPLPRPHAPLSGPIGGKTSGRSATLLEGLPHFWKVFRKTPSPLPHFWKASEDLPPGEGLPSEEVFQKSVAEGPGGKVFRKTLGKTCGRPSRSVAEVGGTNILGVRMYSLAVILYTRYRKYFNSERLAGAQESS